MIVRSQDNTLALRSSPSARLLADREPKLKICVLAACPFPANHGTPGSIREIAEATAERGHEVHVVTYHFGEEIPLKGVHLHRIKPLTRESSIVVGPTARRPLYDLQMVFKAIEVVRRHKIDVMHAHAYEAALAATLCRVVTRCPFLYSAHNSMGDELASYDFFRYRWMKQMANAFAWGLDAAVPRLGNRCLPHSENLHQFLAQRGLEKRCEPVVNFGIDLDELAPGDGQRFRDQYDLHDGPVILYTGVMDHFQRLDLLLHAMVDVVRKQPTAKLVLVVTVPNASHEESMRAKAAELGIADHVILTEPQELPGVREFLQICDVAVVPRPSAPGFPIKLLNYMAAKRACVMYKSSASGLTDGEHALLVPDDTSEALGNAIVQLLDDEALRARLGTNAFQFVRENHDRRLTAKHVCDAYVRLLQGTRRRRRLVDRERVAGVSIQPIENGSTSVTRRLQGLETIQ